MASEKENKLPPYVGHTTFTNFLNTLRDTGLPARIDASLLQNQSGSTQSSVLGALRFFNLIDENGKPSPEFDKLVKATDKERPALWKPIIERSYSFLSDESFDLTKETPATLGQKFSDLGVGGGTREKAVTFFLTAASDAGLSISPHILKHKHAPSGNGQKRAPRTRRAAPGLPPPNPAGNANVTRDPAADLTKQLLDKFPALNPEWSAEVQAKWFDAFEKLMGRTSGDKK